MRFILSIAIVGVCLAPVRADPMVKATNEGDAVVIEASGGSLPYKVVIDPKAGGNIAKLRLPADGPVVARELDDLFFLGVHGEDYTLRGWTGRDRCIRSCKVEIVSSKPQVAVVRVDVEAAGTFKVLLADEVPKAKLRAKLVNYKERTLEATRVCTFQTAGVVVEDEIRWVHPDTGFKTFYVTSAFEPRAVQGPVRLRTADGTWKNFDVASSGGRKVPDGVTFPTTAVTYLRNGAKVSLTTKTTSFDLGKSDFFFYEKPWQQDWFQLAGFMYRLPMPAGKVVAARHEIAFAKAAVDEMPPVVTIASPPWDARWLDEKGEIPKYKIGDTVKLAVSAKNSDGTPVPDADITWDIHIDPWWKTPSAIVRGGAGSYTLPEVMNDEDRTKSKGRNLLGIFTVRVRGKNGVEAVEPLAVLIGRKEP
jgi:hypothetical protein